MFGRNVASYKFALGKSLLELADQARDQVSLDELAVPFARHECEHLKLAGKQGTSAQSRFLDACRAYNRGELTETQLIEQTARLGFSNVIDAYHVVNQGEVPVRFFFPYVISEAANGQEGIKCHVPPPGRVAEQEAASAELPQDRRGRVRVTHASGSGAGSSARA